MITDKQFTDSFMAAGGWFFLTQYETMKNWTGSKVALVDLIFQSGFDKKRSGSNTRVSSSIRIIENGRDLEALVKIRDSASVNRQHPEAEQIAKKLIAKYFDQK